MTRSKVSKMEELPEAEESALEADEETMSPAEASDTPPMGMELEEEASSDNADASVSLVYTGYADTLSYETYRFRRGEPVEVPSDIAEKLLTTYRSEFEVKE